MKKFTSVAIAVVLALALQLAISVPVQAQWATREPATSATWTSATEMDATVPVSVVSYSLAMVTLKATAPIDGTLIFEGSDDNGATYQFTVSCTRTDKPETEWTHRLSASSVASRAWQCAVGGFTHFRVRLNPAISGTGSATVKVRVSQAPINPPAVTTGRGSTTHVTGPYAERPSVIPVVVSAMPPPLTPQQLSNQLLYRAAMRAYCQTNLAGCAPGL